MFELKNYINGEFREGKNTQINHDIAGAPGARIHFATEWDILAAVENLNRVQAYFTTVGEALISELLAEAMDNFLCPEDYCYIARMTGASIEFVNSALEKIKGWAKQSEEFIKSVFANKPTYSRKCNSPTLAILPSNSEEEALFVIVQALLARSALLIRASSRGSASFTVIKFIEAWNKVIDKFEDRHAPLKQVITLINAERLDDLWETVSVDHWNYVVFGSHSTAREISKNILCHSNPRKIVLYDAGLACTVVDKSIQFIELGMPEIAWDVLESVRINRGNECVSSDIIYVHDDVHAPFIQAINSALAYEQSLPPDDRDSLGVVSVPNCAFITETAEALGHLGSIRFDSLEVSGHDGNTIHRPNIKSSLLVLSEVEKSTVFPGPIANVRSFSSREHLIELMTKDLLSNQEAKFLACSLFGSHSFFTEMVPKIEAHTIKHNRPSHEMNFFNPHQGIWLVKELVDHVNVEN